MKRRQVIAASAALFVAGCTGPAAEGGQSETTGTADGGGTTTDSEGTTTGDGDTSTTTGTSTGSVSYREAEFEVVNAACGGAVEEAAVSFDGDAATVRVEGTTTGANACYTGRLADATYDADADEFEVVVESYSDADPNEACADCISAIEYDATASFDGGLPGRVVVVHRSQGGEREVASASP